MGALPPLLRLPKQVLSAWRVRFLLHQLARNNASRVRAEASPLTGPDVPTAFGSMILGLGIEVVVAPFSVFSYPVLIHPLVTLNLSPPYAYV